MPMRMCVRACVRAFVTIVRALSVCLKKSNGRLLRQGLCPPSTPNGHASTLADVCHARAVARLPHPIATSPHLLTPVLHTQ
mmetsp:Transcript_20829/g.62267  ORF Transcript_20829/g.62267 Transcript_20829/m.62267 type:complete len:81 (-) Transcript_20829:264-506(-)